MSELREAYECPLPSMIIEMHPSVKKVAEFMQRQIPADELQGVADALPLVAAVIWGRHSKQQIHPMRLSEQPITRGSQHKQEAAT